MITLTIPGRPPRKNQKHRIFASAKLRGGIGRAHTSDFGDFVGRVTAAWISSKQKPITSGVWVATVAAFWDRKTGKKSKAPPGIALADVDAPIECLFDALQYAGALDDDSRIVALRASKHYDKDWPRIEVVLTRVEW